MLIITSFLSIRSQFFINDTQFLRSMIPHHSYAIQMSTKIKNKTSDPIIKKLAMDIIETQKKEIDLMTHILNEKNKWFNDRVKLLF